MKTLNKIIWSTFILIVIFGLKSSLERNNGQTIRDLVPDITTVTYQGKEYRAYDGVFKYNYCEPLSYEDDCVMKYKYLTIK